MVKYNTLRKVMAPRALFSDVDDDGGGGGGGDYGLRLYNISKFLAFRYDAL
jgi:hypothetical protein